MSTRLSGWRKYSLSVSRRSCGRRNVFAGRDLDRVSCPLREPGLLVPEEQIAADEEERHDAERARARQRTSRIRWRPRSLEADGMMIDRAFLRDLDERVEEDDQPEPVREELTG